MTPSYDEQRDQAVKVTCSVCKREFYMTHPQSICVLCRRKQGK